MCGIAGFTSKTGNITREEYLRVLQLTQLNEKRGNQSTGVAYVNQDKSPHIFKDVQSATLFIPRVINKYTSNMTTVITHTRLATSGAITQPNAHPFQSKNIVGVHNGYVSNAKELGDFNVDSMAIFKMLSIHQNDFEKAFAKLRGGFAIAWIDVNDPHSLYLVRNTNPLYVALTPEGVYFSSLEEALELVLLGVKKKIYELESNKAFRILNGSDITSVDIKFKEYVYTPSKGGYVNHGYDHYYDDYDYDVNRFNKDASETYKIEKERNDAIATDNKGNKILDGKEAGNSVLPWSEEGGLATEIDEDYEGLISADFYVATSEDIKENEPVYCEMCGCTPLFKETWFTDGVYFMCQTCLMQIMEEEVDDFNFENEGLSKEERNKINACALEITNAKTVEEAVKEAVQSKKKKVKTTRTLKKALAVAKKKI